MKKFTLILALLCLTFTNAQDIAFSLENGQITNDGVDDYFEVDVMVSSSADLLVGTGQFYINYNTTTFGTNISSSGAGEFDSTMGVLNGTYWNLIYTDNIESRVSYSFVQLAPAAAYGPDQTITTTPKLFTHLKIKYLPGQVGSETGVCFESGNGFTDLNFTACGGTFGADCFNFPGVQITEDTFDCSGIFAGSSCAITTTWDGASWDNGVPDANAHAIINGPYNTDTQDANINACELTINSTYTLTITEGRFIHVEGDLTVDGNLVVEHQASVVQVDDAATVNNNGNIEIKVETPVLDSRDFMVLGTPMTGETRNGVYASAFVVLKQEAANFVPHPQVAALFPMAENFADDNYDHWSIYETGAISPGEGYIVRPQSGYGQPGGIFDFTHDSGTLNNGVVEFDVVFNTEKNDSPNILANPYPSAISADAFINANAMVNEVYFWEHLTPPSPTLPGAGSMNFSMEDISMYNLMGGTAATADPSGTDTEPNGVISTSQGFGIKAEAAGTAIFNNAMRLDTGNSTLRQNGNNALEKDRIWISISSEQYNLQNTTLIGFSEETTAGLDQSYDSRRLATVLSIFSELEEGEAELGIQSREAYHRGIKIPMGFSTLVDTFAEYTISISHLDGINMEQATVYLYDSLLDVTTNLSETEGYSFISNKGTFNKRFTLLFEEEEILSNNNLSIAEIALYPNPTNGLVRVESGNAEILDIRIYDLQGREVLRLAGGGSSQMQLDLTELSSAVYLIRLSTDRGNATKRIIKE